MTNRIVKNTVVVASLLFGSLHTTAQTAFDGFTMTKGELCLVADYGQMTWTEYWEGKRLRENLNVGKFTSKQFMPMIGYGITNRIALFATVPHISNSSDAGYMAHMKGWQDLQMEAKIQLSKSRVWKGTLLTFGTVGFSTPVSDYIPDFYPIQSDWEPARLRPALLGITNWIKAGLPPYKPDILRREKSK